MVARSCTEDATAPALIDRLVAATSGKSVASLAELLGVSTQAIYNAKNKCKIPKSWIVDVAEQTGVSADWLLRDEASAGKTAADFRDRKIPQMEGGPKGTALDYRDHKIPQMESGPEGRALADLKQPLPPSPLTPVVEAVKPEYVECLECQLAMVPMVEARLSAGTGSFETGDSSERRYAFRLDFLTRKGQPSQMVLMRVDGDSMEPQIFNNDVVLVDQSQTKPRAGGLYAVGVEDVVYIKMVDTLPGKIVLKSFNDAYPPLEIDARGDLADGIRIIGRAVWIGRELY